MEVEVDRRAKALNQCHSAAVGFVRLEPSLAERIARDHAVHWLQHGRHQLGLRGQQWLSPGTEAEPARAGWAQTLARPGGNLTGLFLDLPAIAGKWLQLLREAAPRTQRLGVPLDLSTVTVQLGAAKPAANALGVELIVMEIRSADELELALAAGSKAGMRALMQLSQPLVGTLWKPIADFAIQQRLPGISALRRFAGAGGLMSYSPVGLEM